MLIKGYSTISYKKFVSHKITLHFAVNFTLVIICCCRSLSPQVPHTYHNPTLMASPYSTLPRRPTSSSSGASSANRGQPQQPHHDLRGCPPPIMASAVGRNSPLLELTGMYLLHCDTIAAFLVRILLTFLENFIFSYNFSG